MANKCVMKKTAKYTSEKRVSPAFEANNCCGEYRWGNDMFLYRSNADKNGVCKWQRVKQLKNAASSWIGFGANNILSYGYPYNYDRSSTRSYGGGGNLSPKHDYGTTIDINITPSFDLERLDGKDYKLRGDDDIKEMKKYVSSDDLYEWFTNKLDDLDYVVVDYGIRDTATGLVSASIFHLGDSYKDGIQMNFTVHSKLPLNKDEIRFAVEALTSFDDDGNYPIKFKGGKKYKSTSLVFTSVPSDYKVSTWIMTDKPVNNRYYKNLKAYQVGTKNNKKMPTYPILDAKQYYAPGDEEARFMYPKNKAAHDKHKDSKQVKPSKPTKPSSNKSSCTKRNPSPPCKKGFETKTNKKGNTCCYKSKSKPGKPTKPSSGKSSCTKRNPSPPCKKGFETKTNKKGDTCCYKSKSKPGKPTKPSSGKSSCTKRNPSPPCKKGFETKTNKKGDTCCYKSKSKPNKSSSGISADRLAYINWIDKVLEGKKVVDDSGDTLGYVPNNMNCFRQTAKKYVSPKRKSPPYKANLCCGEVKTGNDGNKWVSIMNKNGVCVWKPVNKRQ